MSVCFISVNKSSNDVHVENPKEKPAFDGSVSNCFCSEVFPQFLMDGLRCNLVLMIPVGSRCSRHIDLITFYALGYLCVWLRHLITLSDSSGLAKRVA